MRPWPRIASDALSVIRKDFATFKCPGQSRPFSISPYLRNIASDHQPALPAFRPPPPRPIGAKQETFTGKPPPHGRYAEILKPETTFREWRIETAKTRVRVSTDYLPARLMYDTMTSHPKLIVASAAEDDGDAISGRGKTAGGVALPLPPGLPVGALSDIICEELSAVDAEVYDCINGEPSEEGTETLRPGSRWSKYASTADVMVESMQGSSQGFFLAVKPRQETKHWDVYYVAVPSLEERIAPAVNLLGPLKTRHEEMTRLKEKIDKDSLSHAQTVVRGAFIGLIVYFGVIGRLVFVESDWDSM